VVDVDLEKFFDRVHHDVLMGRLARRIRDRRLLVLLRRYLEAGILDGGITRERHEGTPQGGPLSPLLANVLLDEVDQELERRGHRFVRYADDLRVFVASRRAGERVLDRLRRIFGRLRLRINEGKSAVARATSRTFLGFRFWYRQARDVRPTVGPEARDRLKARIRLLTRRVRGRSFEEVLGNVRSYLLGWRAYFRPGATRNALRPLDGWIRRRLRAYALKQWPRARAAYKGCRRLGADDDAAQMAAASVGRWWWGAGPPMSRALPTHFFDQAGIPRLGG
jgi:group II intron reverse transcriptase/maturase